MWDRCPSLSETMCMGLNSTFVRFTVWHGPVVAMVEVVVEAGCAVHLVVPYAKHTSLLCGKLPLRAPIWTVAWSVRSEHEVVSGDTSGQVGVWAHLGSWVGGGRVGAAGGSASGSGGTRTGFQETN